MALLENNFPLLLRIIHPGCIRGEKCVLNLRQAHLVQGYLLFCLVYVSTRFQSGQIIGGFWK